MDKIALVTLAIAVLGAVLGVMNTWRQMDSDRVKLSVIPSVGFKALSGSMVGPWRLLVEVVNRSSFPLTIREVGIDCGGKNKMALAAPELLDGGAWPRRLEPRELVLLFFPPAFASHPDLAKVKRVYIRTSCGEVRFGKSPALRAFIKKSKAASSVPQTKEAEQ